jgi:hypothetical protein
MSVYFFSLFGETSVLISICRRKTFKISKEQSLQFWENKSTDFENQTLDI